MKKGLALIFIVAFELMIIFFIGLRIRERRSLPASVISVNPIRKENIFFAESRRLEYFYEPMPNKTIISERPELSIKAIETTNSDTLFAQHDYLVEKSPGIFRIITLGDSFTEGWLVDTPKNYSEILEDLLNASSRCKGIEKFEVINLGVAGYDIEYSAERFYKRGQKYKPDLVLWLLKNDDFTEILEITQPLKKRYRAEMESTEELEKARQRGDFYPEFRKATEELFRRLGKDGVSAYQVRILSKFRDNFGGITVIFTLRGRLAPEYRRIIEEIFQPSHFFEIVGYNPDTMAYPKDAHPNEAGHRRIAEELFDYLILSGLIPCSPNE